MRVEKPIALGLMTRPSEFRRRHYLSVAALSFCPMGDEAALLGEIAMWKFLPEVLPPTQPIDITLPKPAAEFLVTGSAFAPGGGPVRALTVTARLGAVTRRVGVVGDHHIEDGVPTEPAPFTEMPLGWERTYGGPNFAENPLGRGIAEMPLPGIGYRVALPNIVLPAGSATHDAPHPVNLGGMDIAWPQRARLAGTHDQHWLEEDFPGFARDVDFRMAMAAQPDQRFPGFLAGDEDYAITNMHPDEPQLTGRLPGLQPRILVQRRGIESFEDVPLHLTTVWFFPAHRRLVMVHHGRVRTEEEDARDLTALLMGADRVAAPRPVAAFEAVYAARRDPEGGMIASMDEAALVPADVLRPDPAAEELRRKLAEEGLPQRRARARRQRDHERRRAHLEERGIDPDAHGLAPPPPYEPLPSLEHIPAYMAAKAREAEEKRIEGEAQVKREQEAAAARITAAGGTPPDLAAKPAGPPRLDMPDGRARLDARIAELEAQGLPAETERRLRDDPTLARLAAESEDTLRRSYLLTADMQDPAPRRDAAASAALRARLLDGARSAPRLDLCGADLSGMNLAGFDLTEAWLDGADLSGADLTGATLDRAVLAHARLDGAKLVGASLEGANLGRARFEGADLSDANLRDAVLRDADLRLGRFLRAEMEGASLIGANLEGADISEAHLPKLFVQDASLAGLRPVRRGADPHRARRRRLHRREADLRRLHRRGRRWRRLRTRASGTGRVRAGLRAARRTIQRCHLRWRQSARRGAGRRGLRRRIAGRRRPVRLQPAWRVLRPGARARRALHRRRPARRAPDARRLRAGEPRTGRHPRRQPQRHQPVRGRHRARSQRRGDAHRPRAAHPHAHPSAQDPDMSRAAIEALVRDGEIIGAEHVYTGMDLSGADLSGGIFDGAGLAGCDLRGADFSEALLHDVRLDGANLAGARLARSSFHDCTLSRADLSEADCTGWSATGTGLRGANFARANLSETNIVQCRLTRASFAGASLLRANIVQCRTDGIDLSGGDCEEMALVEADLTRADLDAARFVRTNFVKVVFAGRNLRGLVAALCHFNECDMTGCNLSGADLTQAVMAKVKAAGAVFEGARMARTVLLDAVLTQTVLRRADLTSAILQGADLADADAGGAILVQATCTRMAAPRARFTGCDMAHADLSHADLEGADLSGANLARANLHAIRDADALIPDRRHALPPDRDRIEAEQWQHRFA